MKLLYLLLLLPAYSQAVTQSQIDTCEQTNKTMFEYLLSTNNPQVKNYSPGLCSAILQREENTKNQSKQMLNDQQDQLAQIVDNNARLAKLPGAYIGMNKEQVLHSSWGKPQNVNRTITSNTISEQWVYSSNYLYFTNGRLTGIQN